MYKNSIFSNAIELAIKFINSKFPLLTRIKIITHVSTSSFMCACKSHSFSSKVADSMHSGKERLYLRERRGYFARQNHSTGGEMLP